ncbi:MAG: MmgE/PrpD family protein [Aeromicrobium sp.]
MVDSAQTVTEALAAVAAELADQRLAPVDADAVDRAILDWLGVAIGGSGTTVAAALTAGFGGSGSSRIVGTSSTRDPSVAALINGTAAHALELDDIYAPGLFHPGAPVVAAALAMADHVGATWAEMRRAVLIGYEVGCRVAADLGPDHYLRWHTTGTAGAPAAAAAAAVLMGADHDQTADALGLAATMAGGLQQTFRSDAMGKPLHAGHAAQAGVVAAIAAVGGVSGARDALEGDAGLGAATGAPSTWRTSRAGLQGPLAIQRITVKPYPCCGHTFAVIDAVRQLRGLGIEARDVQRVVVAAYTTAIRTAGITQPRTPAEARFSIPYLVAAGWLDEHVGERSFDAARLDEPDRVALLRLVEMTPSAELDAAFPARRGGSVAVWTADRHEVVTVPDRLGSPENPLSAEAIDAKFVATVERQAPGRSDAVLAAFRELAPGDPVAALAVA